LAPRPYGRARVFRARRVRVRWTPARASGRTGRGFGTAFKPVPLDRAGEALSFDHSPAGVHHVARATNWSTRTDIPGLKTPAASRQAKLLRSIRVGATSTLAKCPLPVCLNFWGPCRRNPLAWPRSRGPLSSSPEGRGTAPPRSTVTGTISPLGLNTRVIPIFFARMAFIAGTAFFSAVASAGFCSNVVSDIVVFPLFAEKSHRDECPTNKPFPYSLISTSTPAGRSSFIISSTVFAVGSKCR
jgi:hypothetical protein